MGYAIKLFKATGDLPDTVSRGAVPSQAAANSHKKAKVKCKPTAFDMFVKDKMEEFKAAGVRLDADRNGNLMFTLAVAEWKKLDEDQKQAYTRQFKVIPENIAATYHRQQQLLDHPCRLQSITKWDAAAFCLQV